MARLKMVLGTAQFADMYGVLGGGAGTHANELLDAAHRIGIDALDTSPLYGRAEAMIGASGWGGAVHTKFLGFDSIQAFRAVSLSDLRRNFVDVLYAHDSRVALLAKEKLQQVHRLLVPKYVRHLGVSVYSRDEFLAAAGVGEVSYIQFPHNILDREITLEDRQSAISAGKTLVARSLFLQGLLSSRIQKLPAPVSGLAPYLQSVYAFAAESGFSLVELMVAWLRSQPGIDWVVFGCNNVSELVELVEAVRSDRVPSALLLKMESSVTCPPKTLVDPRNW